MCQRGAALPRDEEGRAGQRRQDRETVHRYVRLRVMRAAAMAITPRPTPASASSRVWSTADCTSVSRLLRSTLDPSLTGYSSGAVDWTSLNRPGPDSNLSSTSADSILPLKRNWYEPSFVGTK